jgi:hypothetical protein
MELAAAKSANIWAQPGTLGFLVVFGMGVILFFVFRSLIKHLRKVNEAARKEAEQAESEQPSDGGPPPVNGHGAAAGPRAAGSHPSTRS